MFNGVAEEQQIEAKTQQPNLFYDQQSGDAYSRGPVANFVRGDVLR